MKGKLPGSMPLDDYIEADQRLQKIRTGAYVQRFRLIMHSEPAAPGGTRGARSRLSSTDFEESPRVGCYCRTLAKPSQAKPSQADTAGLPLSMMPLR